MRKRGMLKGSMLRGKMGQESMVKESMVKENSFENDIVVNLKTGRDFLKNEDGMGTVEIILIIVVLVGLVLIFKEQITKIVDSLFSKISSQTDKV